MEGCLHLIEKVCNRVEQLILMDPNLDMEVWLEKWKKRYVDKLRQVLPDKNSLWLDRKKFQNTSDDDDEDDEIDDNNKDGDGDDDNYNGLHVGRGESLVKMRKDHASTLEGDTSRK